MARDFPMVVTDYVRAIGLREGFEGLANDQRFIVTRTAGGEFEVGVMRTILSREVPGEVLGFPATLREDKIEILPFDEFLRERTELARDVIEPLLRAARRRALRIAEGLYGDGRHFDILAVDFILSDQWAYDEAEGMDLPVLVFLEANPHFAGEHDWDEVAAARGEGPGTYRSALLASAGDQGTAYHEALQELRAVRTAEDELAERIFPFQFFGEAAALEAHLGSRLGGAAARTVANRMGEEGLLENTLLFADSSYVVDMGDGSRQIISAAALTEEERARLAGLTPFELIFSLRAEPGEALESADAERIGRRDRFDEIHRELGPRILPGALARFSQRERAALIEGFRRMLQLRREYLDPGLYERLEAGLTLIEQEFGHFRVPNEFLPVRDQLTP
jgi:hypothetical protein